MKLVIVVGSRRHRRAFEGPKPPPRYRPQRVSVPRDERSRFFAAALSASMAFATLGLFTGLAALFLAITLHHPSHALAGAVLAAIYASAVAAQILTAAWPVTRDQLLDGAPILPPRVRSPPD